MHHVSDTLTLRCTDSMATPIVIRAIGLTPSNDVKLMDSSVKAGSVSKGGREGVMLI